MPSVYSSVGHSVVLFQVMLHKKVKDKRKTGEMSLDLSGSCGFTPHFFLLKRVFKFIKNLLNILTPTSANVINKIKFFEWE